MINVVIYLLINDEIIVRRVRGDELADEMHRSGRSELESRADTQQGFVIDGLNKGRENYIDVLSFEKTIASRAG